MLRDLRQRIELEEETRVDLSPLIDVVFILLIFFIVTTVFVRETGIDVDKPQAVSTQELERNSILIAIGRDGQVVYDGSTIGVHGVRSIVAQLSRNKPRPVVIQVDKRVPTELLVNVLDEAKLAGAVSVNIATTE